MNLHCKRCLLREMGDEELYRRIQRTVAAIPPAERVGEAEYERRLGLCRDCDRFLSGMCRVCGCFVEVRAAREAARCPKAGQPLW